MASKKSNPKTPTSTEHASNGVVAFDGYKEVKERVELAGYWIPEAGPIHGKLVDAYQFIQKSGRGKGFTRTMFVIDLADRCTARVKVEGGGVELAELEPRELCGVIGSVGLRQLVTLGGCFVRIQADGKKVLGNGNEMNSYRLSYKGTPKTLEIRPPFASSETNGAREPGDDSDENSADALPF